MKPTDVAHPGYYHRVVDCQWACPAHTDVPKYLRLIAQGRYTDSYLLNRESNVFPGILGRTCDRPCEPACRRGRVDGKPVAICRLKRVAADLRDDVSELLPRAPATRNGSRVALVGAGPASLTVANDLAPLGYECVVFEALAQPGGLMRTNIPAFRLPASVLDEEIGMILDMGVEVRYGTPVTSMRALLDQGFDAVFVGSGAPKGKELELAGRWESPDHVHIGIDWLGSVHFGHVDAIGRRVLIIGVGNTAMDCCRTSRRLGGEEITVVARRSRKHFKASPWELADAEEEGVQVLENHAPKRFVVENGTLVGMELDQVRWKEDANGRATSEVLDTVFVPCDDVILAIGQENAFPWVERDVGIAFDDRGMPVVDRATMQSTRAGVFFGGDAAWGPQNIIWAVAHGHEAAISIHQHCRGLALDDRPPEGMNLVSAKLGMHAWRYSNDYSPATRAQMTHAELEARFARLSVEVELGFTPEQAAREVERCLNCDVETYFTASSCIECDACVDVCPTSCLTITPDAADEAELRPRLTAPAVNESQPLYVSAALPQTRRVMVKDEDVCLHCGLCAERCPTAAWDMRTFELQLPYAGRVGGRAMNRPNDFAFRIGTVNGTGSASANGLLMQAIFRMGIPVTGKNIFPSNIQGLPTWYEIRVSGAGWTARPAAIDLGVALNPATYARDAAAVREGGYLLYDSSWPMDRALARADLHVLGVPFGAMCVENFVGDRERTLLRNMVYAGSIAALVGIDMAVVDALLEERFGKKRALLDANFRAVRLGADYARAHFDCPLPFRLERMDATRDHVLLDGNSAAALGAVYAGATVGAWYPITPSTSLMEAFGEYCRRWRVDPATHENRYAMIQAEDELSAAGMVIGAGWAGARAFTSTSGPGISLMEEFIGLAYYAEIPGVFVDVQRTGPSTGMPTRTQQGDLMAVAYASHGDTKHVALFPASPEECFTMMVQAFDLAERYQTPVFLVSDLDIGMNDWMCPRLTWDDAYRPDRGKVLSAADLATVERFSRYLDRDGDGIAARTLPGVHAKGAYFTRGSGHDRDAAYTEDSAAYREVVDRIARKIAGAAEAVPPPEVDAQEGATVGLVSIGGCHAAMREAVAALRARGIAVDYLRVRGFPFAGVVGAFLRAHERVFVVEQNRDAQLRSLLAIETGVARDHMTAVLDYGGLPLTAAFVVDEVTRHLAPPEAAAAVALPPLAATPGAAATAEVTA